MNFIRAQIDMLAEMQVNEGQSLRRDVDALRNEALRGIYALEGAVPTLAVAEEVDQRDRDFEREVRAERRAGRALQLTRCSRSSSCTRRAPMMSRGSSRCSVKNWPCRATARSTCSFS